jgi:acetyltransferase-like isoleucine patch superfamily enzyme
LHLNSGHHHNVIGRQQKCIYWVEGTLSIGNTVIYDTDFHVLDPQIRSNKNLDKQGAKKTVVCLANNVFIGAHSTILKGVTIGENSVIGACSLIAKNIPSNEIWAGNPAKSIRKLHD